MWWKVALGSEVCTHPVAKRTLQLFRAQLVPNEKMHGAYERSLVYARETGFLRKRKLRVVLDTTCILARGAVQGHNNRLADGIRRPTRALADAEGRGWSGTWLLASRAAQTPTGTTRKHRGGSCTASLLIPRGCCGTPGGTFADGWLDNEGHSCDPQNNH